MRKLDLVDLNHRGDKDFEALSEVEKNLYVLLLFVTLYEMEGITHFFSHRLKHVPRLLAFLAAIKAPNSGAVRDLAHFLKAKAGGTWDRDALDTFLNSPTTGDDQKIDTWAKEYYSNTQEMWAKAREYVRRHHDTEFN